MMRHRRRVGVIALATVLLVAALPRAGIDTAAAWADTEQATGAALTAGRVSPPTALACTAGALAPVTFSWTAPSGGLPITGYRYVFGNGFSGSGTLAANATSVSFTSGFLGLGIGSGTFTLYAVVGTWDSTPVQGSLSFITVALSGCSVP